MFRISHSPRLVRRTRHCAVFYLIWLSIGATSCGVAFGESADLRRVVSEGQQLDAPDFRPTPARSTGWRGDGTGRYPGATPPLTWDRRRGGQGYTVSNILWSVKLPDWSVDSPIVVRDRMFVTAESSDLVCLDKRTGRILSIRSKQDDIYKALLAIWITREPRW